MGRTALTVPVKHVVVIDIGKTNAKCVVFDCVSQKEIAVESKPNVVASDGPYPHFEAEKLWAFILECLRKFAATHAVDAISITTHGASAALLNQHGDLALPLLDYEFAGPDSLAADYDAVRPAFAETGSPRLPVGLNLGAQLFWQQNSYPSAFAQVSHILPYPQYWAYKLTGVLASEVTSWGCHTDLWNYSRRDYSTLVDRQEWRKLFPPLHKANAFLGPILPAIAKQTGLPDGTPVCCGIHDSNASLYPHLLEQSVPFSVVSTGTWVICMALGGTTTTTDPARDTLVNINAFGEPVISARFMGGREYQDLHCDFSGTATIEDEKHVLDRGMMILPSVVQGSGPFAHRAMQWINADGILPVQKHVAASWYLAMMTTTCLQLVGARGPIIVEGPFGSNTAYLRMLAAATQRPVKAVGGTGTTHGAALLCSEPQPKHQQHDWLTVSEQRLSAYARQWLALVNS